RRDAAEPLTAELSRLHITVSRRFLDKLEAARAALSHGQKGASAESILEAGLDLVLKRHAARRGLVEKPRAESAASESAGGIPASVKREVWKRDGGRCQWPLDSGGICQSTLRVEYDHIIPRALGGSSRPGNLRLLCRFHNDLAARRAFGPEWMNQFTGDPAQPKRRVGS
ncbi:MAG: HNH endonuclease, partial [Deltaproteobacteria bacterium]